MNARIKTRSDYHSLFSSPSTTIEFRRETRWLKPLLWIGLGFMLGMVYTKIAFSPERDAMRMSADNTTKSTAQLKEPKTHTAAKGIANSSKV